MLEDDKVETEEVGGGVIITYYYDPEPLNPQKEYDQPTTICHWHQRYDLGDRQATDDEITALRLGGLEGLRRHLERNLGEGRILALEPVALLDHSGLHMWVGSSEHWSDPGGWDSGIVGFAYVSQQAARLMLNGDETTDEQAADALEQDVKAYDDYLTGNCYGYVISTPTDDHAGSCWGFLGDIDYCKEEARAEAQTIRAEYETVELALAVMGAAGA